MKFVLALAALLVYSVFGLAFPAVLGKLLDGAIAGQGSAWFHDLNRVAALLVGILVVQTVFSYVQAVWFVEVGERTLKDLRQDTYGRILTLPMAFFARRRVGELASRLSADLTQIQETLTWTVSALLRQSLSLAGGLVLIFWTSAKLALVMLVSLPPLVGLAVFFGWKIRGHSQQAQDRLAESQTVVEESLQGIATVKAFANEAYEAGRYRGALERYLGAVLRVARLRGAFFSLIMFGLFCAAVLVMWVGARMVQAGELTAGRLTSFMLYTLFVGAAMGAVAELYSLVQRALGATERVRELLREPPEALEASPAPGPHPVEGRLRGAVAFETVSFRYPSRPEVEVLAGVTFEIPEGRRVALVGPSGAGKSTVVALLLRFYEPGAGRILLGGRPSADYPLSWLRRQVSLVPQEVLLFGGSILENIAYGRPGASEADVVEAARRAHAHEFIERFPDGYATVVGERGVQLSGGQRQRVAIARAILTDPALLILDEATSSLDAESEHLIQQGLEALMKNRTSLIIAHRLSTIRQADEIVVLKEGRVVERGTHRELMDEQGGLYRTLSRLQLEPA